MAFQLLVRTALAAVYLAIVHAAILTHRPALALGGLATASGVNVAAGLVRQHAKGIILFWSGVCAAMLALTIAAILGHDQTVRIVLLPSVFLNVGGCLFFARTLLPGNEPLIVQVIRADIREVPADMAAYARGLTMVWTVFFASMTAACVGLALWADLATWSWFANVLNPLAAALLFFGEHLIRPRRFGGPASPARTIRLMLQARLWSAAPQ